MTSSRPHTILIVEDEWLIAESLKESLESAGYQVRGPAGKVSDALKLVEANGLDAAVLDINLRGEKSFPIAQALTERAIPFAFMTGYVSAEILEGFRNRPVLNKPVEEKKLVSCIADLLKGRP